MRMHRTNALCAHTLSPNTPLNLPSSVSSQSFYLSNEVVFLAHERDPAAVGRSTERAPVEGNAALHRAFALALPQATQEARLPAAGASHHGHQLPRFRAPAQPLQDGLGGLGAFAIRVGNLHREAKVAPRHAQRADRGVSTMIATGLKITSSSIAIPMAAVVEQSVGFFAGRHGFSRCVVGGRPSAAPTEGRARRRAFLEQDPVAQHLEEQPPRENRQDAHLLGS